MTTKKNQNGDIVVHYPFTFQDETPAAADDDDRCQEQAARKLAFKSISNTSESEWKRFDSYNFQPIQPNDDSVVLQYNVSPPKIDISSSSSIEYHSANTTTVKTQHAIHWCMSVTSKRKNSASELESSGSKSPTDFNRYKTRLILKERSDEWKPTWKKLCKSLQNGHLEYCNAYYKERCEIVVYHYGSQQAQIGEWIWTNVRVKYSKNTTIILCDNKR